MQNEKRQITTKEDIITILFPVFQRKGVRRAVLFGSYAEGTQTENSDIDILVDSGMRGLRFYGLLEDVCQSVNHPVDLIDVYQIKPGSKIAREIANKGIVIYEQP